MCPDPTGSEIECDDGYYQVDTGQASCDQCPAGSSCIDKSVAAVACSDGFFSLLGEKLCEVHSDSNTSFIVAPTSHNVL